MSETTSQTPADKPVPGAARALKALAARLEQGPAPDLDELSEALYAIRSGGFDRTTKKLLLEAREGIDEGKVPDPLVLRMLAKAVIDMPPGERQAVKGQAPDTSDVNELHQALAAKYNSEPEPEPEPLQTVAEVEEEKALAAEYLADVGPEFQPPSSERAIMEAPPKPLRPAGAPKLGRPRKVPAEDAPKIKNGNGTAEEIVVKMLDEAYPDLRDNYWLHDRSSSVHRSIEGKPGLVCDADAPAPLGGAGFIPRDAEYLSWVPREIFCWECFKGTAFEAGALGGKPEDPLEEKAPIKIVAAINDDGRTVIFDSADDLSHYDLLITSADLLLDAHSELAGQLYNLAELVRANPVTPTGILAERARRRMTAEIEEAIQRRTAMPSWIFEWLER